MCAVCEHQARMATNSGTVKFSGKHSKPRQNRGCHATQSSTPCSLPVGPFPSRSSIFAIVSGVCFSLTLSFVKQIYCCHLAALTLTIQIPSSYSSGGSSSYISDAVHTVLLEASKQHKDICVCYPEQVWHVEVCAMHALLKHGIISQQ